MSVRPRATDEARVIQVIETISNRGAGTLDDPCRPVKQYWDFDGKFLAEFDPCLPNEDTKDIRYINRMKREKSIASQNIAQSDLIQVLEKRTE